MVAHHGFQPFTMESAYFLMALSFKKMIILNEKVDHLSSQLNSIKDCGVPQISEARRLRFPKPVLTNLDQYQQMKNWTSDELEELKLTLRDEGGETTLEVVKLMLKRLMSTDLMAKFNRTGTDGKERFSEFIETIVKDAVHEKYRQRNIEFDGRDIEKKVASVLKTASNKFNEGGLRKKRKLVHDDDLF